MGKIYIATSLTSGKSYIGQTTKDVKTRWNNHCCKAKLVHKNYMEKLANDNNNKPAIILLNEAITELYACPVLTKAIIKYGEQDFIIDTIWDESDYIPENYAEEVEECEKNGKKETLLDIMEKVLIKLHDTLAPNGYNASIGGVGKNGISSKHSKSTRAKMSESGRKNYNGSFKLYPYLMYVNELNTKNGNVTIGYHFRFTGFKQISRDNQGNSTTNILIKKIKKYKYDKEGNLFECDIDDPEGMFDYDKVKINDEYIDDFEDAYFRIMNVYFKYEKLYEIYLKPVKTYNELIKIQKYIAVPIKLKARANDELNYINFIDIVYDRNPSNHKINRKGYVVKIPNQNPIICLKYNDYNKNLDEAIEIINKYKYEKTIADNFANLPIIDI